MSTFAPVASRSLKDISTLRCQLSATTTPTNFYSNGYLGIFICTSITGGGGDSPMRAEAEAALDRDRVKERYMEDPDDGEATNCARWQLLE